MVDALRRGVKTGRGEVVDGAASSATFLLPLGIKSPSRDRNI